MTVPTPNVEYGLLSPMLIILGVAVVGVLVEAFVPRQQRYAAQLVLSLGGLVASFVAVVVLARDLRGGTGRTAVLGAVAVDAPALFLQATILLVGVLGILLIAERRIVTTAASIERAPLELTTPLLRISPQVDTTAEDLETFAATLAEATAAVGF